MKLIVLSGLRGAHAELYILLKETVADAYLVCGELLDGPFYSSDASAEFISLRNQLTGLLSEKAPLTGSLEEFASRLAEDPSAADDARDKARSFLDLGERARQSALRKYRMLENIFSTKPYTEIYTVPGNGDMDLSGTPLRERCLSGKACTVGSHLIAGTRIAGCADEVTASEFLSQQRPHVLAIPEERASTARTGTIPLVIIFPVKSAGTSEIIREGAAVKLLPSGFGTIMQHDGLLYEGGFFYECTFRADDIARIILKKLAGERVIDIVEYFFPAGGHVEERIVDPERFAAMKESRAVDLPADDTARAPEIRLFRDIRNYFRIHQTQETERRVELLQEAIESLGDDRSRVSLDLVGSTNVGLSGKSSDVDMVLYLRAGGTVMDEISFRREFDAMEERIREKLAGAFDFEVIDRIDLDRVEAGIRDKNLDCDAAQLFVTYRSACRPVNYRALSPLEDLLNRDIPFRRELEERMRSYLRMFARTSDNSKSFEKYLNRLKTSGIAIPDYLEKKINLMLQKKRG